MKNVQHVQKSLSIHWKKENVRLFPSEWNMTGIFIKLFRNFRVIKPVKEFLVTLYKDLKDVQINSLTMMKSPVLIVSSLTISTKE